MNTSKRHFLRSATGLSLAAGSTLAARLGSPLAGSLAALGALAAHAQSAGSDYKALVCLFMAGGNDGHNWVVPIDSSGYADYAAARSNLALPAASLLPLTPGTRQAAGRRFGMPAELAPLRELYESRELALLANVGPLLQPTSRAQYNAGAALPPKLFSHNDQTSSWQALAPEGARAGWGGRIGDALIAANAYPVFTTVSATGNAVFLSGGVATQYQISPSGALGIGGLNDRYTLGSSSIAAVLRKTQYDAGDNPFQAELSRVVKRSAEAYSVLSGQLARTNVLAIPSDPIARYDGSILPLSQLPLAQQLRAVAQMISAGQAMGMKRQVFMVAMSGFDTHGNQLRDQPALMSSVALSTRYFMNALRALNLQKQVTLFSASDFGRTLTSNGSGSDHGWGGHHFIAGGAVRGGDIYGRFPVTALGSADDIGSGRLLPSTAVTEYAATLARWMGVSASDLPTVLPNVGSFGSADLGFV